MNDSKNTFRGLFEKYDYIYIPRIQRDYAQGRDNEEAKNIRDNILDDLEKMKPLSLGIIFGVSENRSFVDGTNKKCFIPVDGQQRLTTLYLLHLYGNKCHNIQFEHLKKFSYETRSASKDFICNIVEHWHEKIEDKISLKEHIINQGWFLNYWILDPTVDAMLNMLTAINERFRNRPEVFENLDRISFEFLDLNNLKLNETLYLKMNSRGRKLSQFDKIKSEIDKILPEQTSAECQFDLYEDEHLKTLSSFDQKWRYCIDRKWSELFWDRKTHTFDTSFLSFLTNYLVACAGEEYSNLLDIDFRNDSFYLSWKYFGEYLKSGTYLMEMATILNKLVYNLGRTDIVKDIIVMPKSHLDRAMKFGLISFRGTDYSSKEFEEWKRFIHNYVTHTVNNKDTFLAFAKKIKEEFSKESENILAYLANQYDPEKYERSQLNEEYFKAHAILFNGEELRQTICQAENHPLLDGRLRPLIADGNKYDEMSFPKIYQNFCKCFGEKGDRLEFKEYGDKSSLLRRTQFATAFVKGLTRREQLEKCTILDLSESGLKENLKQQRLEPVFRRCLLSDQLYDMAESEWQNPQDIEYFQLKKTLLQPGVIQGILKRKIGEKLRFQWYHNCTCFCPYNGKSSNKRIGVDRISDDPKWTRNRNRVLFYLIGKSYSVDKNDNKPVSDVTDIALWWGSDICFQHPNHHDIQLWWNADYNVGIIQSSDNTTWIKRPRTDGKDENYLFNAVGMNEEQIEKELEKLIQEYLREKGVGAIASDK